jgi:hypothetical protein
MNVFKRFFSSLQQEGVQYLVAGGVAVNLYGIERATADVDIVLKLDNENIGRFIAAARKLGLRPKMPVDLDELRDPAKRKRWVEEKHMSVFSLHDPKEPFFLLDVFVETPFPFDEVYAKRENLRYEEVDIPVVPIQNLIEMKTTSTRPQDKADIFYLKKILEDWQHE